jgi:hypothetical protein
MVRSRGLSTVGIKHLVYASKGHYSSAKIAFTVGQDSTAVDNKPFNESAHMKKSNLMLLDLYRLRRLLVATVALVRDGPSGISLMMLSERSASNSINTTWSHSKLTQLTQRAPTIHLMRLTQ